MSPTQTCRSLNKPASRARASWLLGCCLCWLLPAAARAEDDFMRHYRLGLELYKSERYADSIKEFELAHSVRQFPRTFYNIGLANLKLGKAQETVTYLQRYLELEPEPPPDVAAKAHAALAQGRKMLEAPAPAEPTPSSPEPPAVLASTEPPPVPPPSPSLLAPKSSLLHDGPGPSLLPRSPRPRWRIGSGAVGLAVGAGLGGLGISALSVNGRCVDMPGPFSPCSQDYNTIGVGAGFLATGVVLICASAVLIAIPGRRSGQK